MFSGLCELSGQPLASASETQTIVVTPSGHVCFKHLILTKLSENGGVDPFETTGGEKGRPLSEDDLTELNPSGSVVPPRPNPATSMPMLLGLLQKEYDALVLELFDTRKALEETRKELSQALYQNDAAVRVVARISQERDAARQELAQWKASGGSAEAAAGSDEPSSKRFKKEESAGPMENDIPDSHVEQMSQVRNELQPSRKKTVKAAAAAAPSADELKTAFAENADSKSWHKSSCKAIAAIASHGTYVATGGKDKQVIVYDSEKKVVLHSFSVAGTSLLDMNEKHVVVAHGSSQITLLDYSSGSTVGTYSIDDGDVVDVRLHPTKAHIVAAVSTGAILLLGIGDDDISLISTFTKPSSTTYTSGVMQPDGFIYLVGTTEGSIDLWDFQNKRFAGCMGKGDDSGAVTDIAFSNNGYYLATSHASGAVKAWDLRKQKVMSTMNENGDEISDVTCLSFDHGGKYLAYGGSTGVVVTTVKEWGVTAKFDGTKISGIAWGPSSQWIATSSSGNRNVQFFGK